MEGRNAAWALAMRRALSQGHRNDGGRQMTAFLLLAFTFLIAGVVAVPLATRFGLGSVLGYLIAGIAIAPLLAALGVDVISIQHFAEFGVVMMLFLVGLELEPKHLWDMRGRLLGLGGGQVALTTLAIQRPGDWSQDRLMLSTVVNLERLDEINRLSTFGRIRN